MVGGLIQTKLSAPQLRPLLVQRPRLFRRLDESARGKLTLVSAPAGYGKSTLVCAWIHDKKRESPNSQFCWLSLDVDDDDPVHFLTYFASALQGVSDKLGAGTLGMLQASRPPAMNTLVAMLIDAIVQADIAFTVVLDDYQNISATVIHDTLTFLLEYQPPQMHLVLLTREDPPLPLSRLRAGGQMAEIRFHDLRFDVEDTAAFLNDIMHLNLSENEIAALEERTEGWIAGLQLAALSMRGLDDTRSFVQSFTGSSRYVLDYLIEEVFQRQTADVKDFLLQTAVLERFSAPLCDAVTGRDDSADVLLQLEQANLFIVALDESRQWYRYHQLFADLLRHRTRRQGLLASESHERASRWYEANDFPAEAIKHALEAKSWNYAADLLENNSTRMLKHGQIATLLRWAGALPEDAIVARPELCISLAWALALSRKVDEAERYLEPLLPMAEQYPVFWAQVLTLQAHIARTRHDIPRTIAYSQRALGLLPTDDFNSRSILGVNLGVAHLYSGDLTAAKAVWMAAAENAQRAKNHHACILAMSFAGQVQAAWGDLHDGASLQRRAIRLGEENRALPATGRARVNLAALLYEWNELETAVSMLQSALELSKRTGDNAVEWDAYRTLALVRQAQGKNGEATEAIERAHDAARYGEAPANLRLANMIVHLQIALRQNDLAAAARCYRASQALDDDGVSWRSDLLVNAGCLFSQPGLTWARFLLARGEDRAAAALLADCYEAAAAAGLPHDQINARVWQALAAADKESAVSFLTEAVFQGQPEGFVRSFIDAGAALRPLLQELVSLEVAPVYLGQLVAALEAKTGGPALSRTPRTLTAPAQPLIEPLSDRELQIVQLLADRQTNAEIALAIVVSVNTVKTHLQHIYEKLGVHDRRTAVVRARELQLIEE